MKETVNVENGIFHKASKCFGFDDNAILAKASRINNSVDKNTLYIIDNADVICFDSISKSKGVIVSEDTFIRIKNNLDNVLVVLFNEHHILDNGCVLTISKTGRIVLLYRPNSKNNALFITDSCNNYCIMCPQPPKPSLDNSVERKIRKIIDIMDPSIIPEKLGITGGEPTMIKDGLVEIINDIRSKYPETRIELLTNGRFLKYSTYTNKIAKASKGNMIACIPLYAPVAYIHDYIVQSKGAFDQTVSGILECHRNNIAVEIRIVLNKITLEHLSELADFISRNFMFVSHVAIMGIEYMGFAKKHFNLLHYDPVNHSDRINEAVKLLTISGINVFLYNMPLCVVDKSIRHLCKKSISDFKNVYAEECSLCTVKDECCGTFSSNFGKYVFTSKISPIQ